MERETGLEPATSSLGSHSYVESKSLVRFCCELLNLQHLAKSAIFESVPANEAQTRQVLHSIITPMVATGGTKPSPVHTLAIHEHRTAPRFDIAHTNIDQEKRGPRKEPTYMKRDTKFKPGVSGNETARWGPGQSGNPAGKSKGRARFEEAFNEALITQGSAEEAAQLLWQAARGKEPWAIQEVCRAGPASSSWVQQASRRKPALGRPRAGRRGP